MVLPALAAGAARVAAVGGRAVVGAARAGAKVGASAARGAAKGAQKGAQAAGRGAKAVGRGAKRAQKSTSQMRSQLQQARRQFKQVRQYQDQATQFRQQVQQNPDEDEAYRQPRSPAANKFRAAPGAFGGIGQMRMGRTGKRMPRALDARRAFMQQPRKAPARGGAMALPGIGGGLSGGLGGGGTATQDLVKRNAKASFKRGMIWLANTIAVSLDLGTMGIALIVDFAVYSFTFGYLNTEMVYGRWIAKGKHPLIGPISWAPIPMPIDKDAKILQGALIMLNIILILSATLSLIAGLFYMFVIIQIIVHPVETLKSAGGLLWDLAATFFTNL